ncbi:MAG: MFS transporter [Xanthomonadales bacterium]|jgi:MFS family permease|nr:MFS transporter [Xanthomonadales bacterium]MDH3939542.1 MFS transporter [Xanthomonadales bacterium]MDH4001011.1 MFS transporter [Xanthomonadales bacterium]
MHKFQQSKSPAFFALLSLPSTAMGFALSIQISALSWILTTQYQLDIHDVGLVWAAGPLAGILGQVIIGVISDKVWFWNGRRRPFILIGGMLAALMLLALPNLDVISANLGVGGILGVAIAVALTLDLAINVSFNPTRSIIADVTDEGDERTKGYTWMQSISGTFGVLAYAVGAVFDNYVLIYAGAVIVLLFSIVPTLFITEPRELESEPKTPAEAVKSQKQDSLLGMLIAIRPLWGFLVYDIYAMGRRMAGIEPANYYAEIACAVVTVLLVAQALLEKETADGGRLTSFRKVIAAHSFSWVGIQTTFVFLFPFLQQQLPGMSDIDLGRVGSMSFLVLNAVGALLPAVVLMPLAHRIGRIKTHVICMAFMTAGYVGLYGFGVSPAKIYLLMAVLGIGWAAIVSLPFAIVSQKVSQARMGLFMGLFNLSVVLPQLVVSLGVALLISRAPDKNIIFAISAASLALSAIAWSFVREDD